MDFFTLVGLLVILYLFVYFVVLSVADCDLGLLWAEKFGIKLDKLKGKVVWITGASSGIGAQLADILAQNGVKLILTARNEKNLQLVRQKCIDHGLSPEEVVVLPFDVTEISKHEFYFEKALQYFNHIDILINNAGRSQRAMWEDIELEVDREIFELNVFSVVSLSRFAVNYFNKRDSGHIVVMSSLAGIIGAPYSGSYTATKHALQGYFNSLRIEKLGTNLAVTLLCPGPVFSNFLAESFTSKTGEKFSQAVDVSDKRMDTSRCATLCAIAIANELEEAWMGLFPVVPLCYVLRYCPNLARRLMKIIGLKRFQKMRDSKEMVKDK